VLPLYWLAIKSGGWLCVLPLLLRIYSLPVLLQRITGREKRKGDRLCLDVDRSAGVIGRVCQLRLFRLPFFPRDCLRQSLVLYNALTGMGYPAIIHFGVQKQRSALEGHSWVTLHGRPIGEQGSVRAFATVYSYPVSTAGNLQSVHSLLSEDVNI
jgi:hypothetical protein